jgi:hypothetical protein
MTRLLLNAEEWVSSFHSFIHSRAFIIHSFFIQIFGGFSFSQWPAGGETALRPAPPTLRSLAGWLASSLLVAG